MTKEKQKLICLMRAFFAELGIDSFLTKKIPTAIGRIVWTIVLIAATVVSFLMTSNNPNIIFGAIALCILMLIRKILFFVSGLLLIKKDSEEFLKLYE